MKFDELLREYHVPVAPEGHEHSRHGWLQFDCPFCSRGWRHYRMGYNLANKYVNCWACGRHDLVSTLEELIDLPRGKIIKLLGEVERDRSQKVEDVRGKLVLPKHRGPLLKQHRKYLRSRGYDPDELVKLWGLEGIGLALKLQWRIFIPIHFHGEIVSWTTRSLRPDGTRYISASPTEEVLNHKHLLYGEDYVRHAVIVHEGPTDVWRTGPGAVGVLGTSFLRSQVARLARFPVRVICFDNEVAAQKRAEQLASQLEPFGGRTFNVQLDAKDASTASDREIRKLRKFLK